MPSQFSPPGSSHAAIFISARSGIRSPQDLIGKRIGEAFTYGHDAGVWVKGILHDDYGVRPESARYFIGGVNNYVPFWDWLPFNPYYHSEAVVEQLGPGKTLAQMLETGEIDALYAPIVPQPLLTARPTFGACSRTTRPWSDRTSRERHLPRFMHTMVIRRDLYRREPWIAQSLYSAFKELKERADQEYRIGDGFMHNYFMVPWFATLRDENRWLMGGMSGPTDWLPTESARRLPALSP